MASVPDRAILSFYRLTPAEIKVYSFYCKCRNNVTGGWQCPDLYTANKMRMSRNRVCEARLSLKKRGWIRCFEQDFIMPVYGFRAVENSTGFVEDSVENSTNSVENSTNSVENSTAPLKEVLNQPSLPAHLPVLAQNPRNANFAKLRDNKNFEIDLSAKENDLSFAEADAKSPKDGRINSKTGLSLAEAGAKPGERKDHPAIRMVREISGRFPHKDQWDKIIREVGDNPDTEFFRAAWEIWRSFDGKPTNLQGWLFKPNEKAALPEVFDNGKSPPKNGGAELTYEIDVGEKLRDGLQILKEVRGDGEDWDTCENQKWYTPEEWKWLKAEMAK